MNKRKASICTILLTIILIGIVYASIFIKNSDGSMNLFYILGSMSLGNVIYNISYKFYQWILKEEECFMSKKNYYYDLCKECEHLYHCYGKDIGEEIENDNVDDMLCLSSGCNDFYPIKKL